MTAKQVIEKLQKDGWVLDRIHGSHHIFEKEGHIPLSVPVHDNTDMGVFAKRLLKQAGIE